MQLRSCIYSAVCLSLQCSILVQGSCCALPAGWCQLPVCLACSPQWEMLARLVLNVGLLWHRCGSQIAHHGGPVSRHNRWHLRGWAPWGCSCSGHLAGAPDLQAGWFSRTMHSDVLVPRWAAIGQGLGILYLVAGQAAACSCACFQHPGQRQPLACATMCCHSCVRSARSQAASTCADPQPCQAWLCLALCA